MIKEIVCAILFVLLISSFSKFKRPGPRGTGEAP